MKYNRIITESLNNIALKRVRIKVDPASINVTADLTKCDGYEGYVLAECDDLMKVLVVQPNDDGSMSIMDIPNEYLEMLTNIKQNLEDIKRFIITALNVSDDDPLIMQIAAASSIDDIEAFLKDRGLTEEEITKLYKYYIAHE